MAAVAVLQACINYLLHSAKDRPLFRYIVGLLTACTVVWIGLMLGDCVYSFALGFGDTARAAGVSHMYA